MDDFERTVLSQIHFGNMPTDPRAAWLAAREFLAVSGYIKAGKLTRQGLAALSPKEGQADG